MPRCATSGHSVSRARLPVQHRGWPPRRAGASVRPVRAELSDDPGPPNPPRWCAVVHPAPAGLALIAVAMLPPVETLARRYLFVESIQFCLLSMAGPALIVLGAPWRVLRLSRGRPEEPAGRPHQAGAHLGFADRLAAGRRRRPSFVRAAGFLAWWAGGCLCWRLPPVLDALARHPALSLAELATLVAAGVGLWLELVNSPPLAPRLARAPPSQRWRCGPSGSSRTFSDSLAGPWCTPTTASAVRCRQSPTRR